jgi:hypothetical protein
MGSFGFGFGGHGSDEEMADGDSPFGGAGFGASPPRTRERPQEVVDLPLPLEALYTGGAGIRRQLVTLCASWCMTAASMVGNSCPGPIICTALLCLALGRYNQAAEDHTSHHRCSQQQGSPCAGCGGGPGEGGWTQYQGVRQLRPCNAASASDAYLQAAHPQPTLTVVDCQGGQRRGSTAVILQTPPPSHV